MRHAGLIKEMESPYGGRDRIIGSPLKLTATPMTATRPAPGPGQHSAEVLGELGYSEAELEKLLADKVALQWAKA